jgi:hypothetical protein
MAARALCPGLEFRGPAFSAEVLAVGVDNKGLRFSGPVSFGGGVAFDGIPSTAGDVDADGTSASLTSKGYVDGAISAAVSGLFGSVVGASSAGDAGALQASGGGGAFADSGLACTSSLEGSVLQLSAGDADLRLGPSDSSRGSFTLKTDGVLLGAASSGRSRLYTSSGARFELDTLQVQPLASGSSGLCLASAGFGGSAPTLNDGSVAIGDTSFTGDCVDSLVLNVIAEQGALTGCTLLNSRAATSGAGYAVGLGFGAYPSRERMLATGAVPVAPHTDEAYGSWASFPHADRQTAYHSTLSAALCTPVLDADDVSALGRAVIDIPDNTQFYPTQIIVACMPKPGVSASPVGTWHLNFGQPAGGGSGHELFSNVSVNFSDLLDSRVFQLSGNQRALRGQLILAHHGGVDATINYRLRVVVCGVVLAVPA